MDIVRRKGESKSENLSLSRNCEGVVIAISVVRMPADITNSNINSSDLRGTDFVE